MRHTHRGRSNFCIIWGAQMLKNTHNRYFLQFLGLPKAQRDTCNTFSCVCIRTYTSTRWGELSSSERESAQERAASEQQEQENESTRWNNRESNSVLEREKRKRKKKLKKKKLWTCRALFYIDILGKVHPELTEKKSQKRSYRTLRVAHRALDTSRALHGHLRTFQTVFWHFTGTATGWKIPK